MATIKATRETIEEFVEGIQGRINALKAEIERVKAARQDLRAEVMESLENRIVALPDLESIRNVAAAVGAAGHVDKVMKDLRERHEEAAKDLASYDPAALKKDLSARLDAKRAELVGLEAELAEAEQNVRFKEGEIGYLGKGAFWPLKKFLDESRQALRGDDPQPSWWDRTFNGPDSQELKRRVELRAEIVRRHDEFEERTGQTFDDVAQEVNPLERRLRDLRWFAEEVTTRVEYARKEAWTLERMLGSVDADYERAESRAKTAAEGLGQAADRCREVLYQEADRRLVGEHMDILDKKAKAERNGRAYRDSGEPRVREVFAQAGLFDRADLAKEERRDALESLWDGLQGRIKGYERDLTCLWDCIKRLDYASSPQVNGIQLEGKGEAAEVGFDFEAVRAALAESKKADVAILHGAAGLRASLGRPAPESADIAAIRADLAAKVEAVMSKDAGSDAAPGKLSDRIPADLGIELDWRAERHWDPNRRLTVAM